MRDLLETERSRAESVAEQCDCCPYPCCDYCQVQISWTVIASATRSSGVGAERRVETVNWSVALVLVFERDNEPGTFDPEETPTFRTQEGISGLDDEIDECQLLSNGGPFEASGVAGTYSYSLTVGGTEVDSEDEDLMARVDSFNISLNCDCLQLDFAPTTASFAIDAGIPGLGTFPGGWGEFFRGSPLVFEDLGAETACVGVASVTETDELTGWDESSLVKTASFAITRCEDL